METIYMHNITVNELGKLCKMIPGREIVDKDNYEKQMSADLKYADLFRLYSLRGERKLAETYLEKIKDYTLRYLLQ